MLFDTPEDMERRMKIEGAIRHRIDCAKLRDGFAMAALTGLLANAATHGYSNETVYTAYHYADEMLAEREKAQPKEDQ